MSIVLALFLCAALFTPFASAAEDVKTVYGAQSLEYVVTSTSDLHVELLEENGEKYIHYTCEAGSYANGNLITSFTPEGISLYDYPYVVIGYRTNSTRYFSMNMFTNNGESWLNGDPATTGDGKWHDVIVNMNDMVGGAGVATASEIGIRLTIKPFGAHEKTLSSSGYVDYKYIACFKTLEEAKSFKYTGESDPIGADIEITETPYYKADDAYIAELEKMTEERIEAIISSPTDVKVSGKSYYVSATGNDSADGLTTETAWQTISRVNSFKFEQGDAVFFKRGDSFRTVEPLKSSGLTLSAYGSGAKPKIIASVDASGADKWQATEYENVWVFADPIDVATRDVGVVVFDGGRAWGIKVTRADGNKRIDNGLCSNGIDEPYEIDKAEFVDHRDLAGNLEFYHNWDDNKLYIYSKNGNPGEIFTSIELADKGHAIAMGSNTVIDNLEVFGTGSHGIGGGTVKNVVVQNCVFSWVGGSLQSTTVNGTTRFGNAVESYGSSDNYIIRNCYATQIYDCCWTAQVNGPGVFNNVSFYGNVAEYSNTGLEVWQEGGTISGLDLYDNITRYSGYGWSHQRPNNGGDMFKNEKNGNPYFDGNFFYGGYGGQSTTYDNNHVRNNINYLSATTGLAIRATGTAQYNFHDNIYVMPQDKTIGMIAENPGRSTGGLWRPQYTEENVLRAVKTGFEAGSKFYYVDAGYTAPLYKTVNGVELFDDVAENFWGREYVDFVTLKGLFNGVSANKFSPDGTMTRAMLVTVLGRLSQDNVERVNDISFADVEDGAWYAPYVGWAVENRIVDTTLASFRPNDNATREELADMLYRFAVSEFKDTDISDVSLDHVDAAKIGEKYVDGVRFCVANGIISGYGDSSIKPQGSATRTEVSAMLKRFVNYLTHMSADEDRALAASKKLTFTGKELRSIMDISGVRATVIENGIELKPFTESGKVTATLYDYMSKDIRFVDYPTVVIKYRTSFESDVFAELMYKTTASYEMESAGVTAKSETQGCILLDCTSYYSTISNAAYDDDCGIAIYPWGRGEVDLGTNDSFVIESVTFFESANAAARYVAEA